tara:strand:- start:3033 stop:3614 length:582 start_codon:yes stop_codon:yes gene_type:complete
MNREEVILKDIWNELNSSLKQRNHPFHIFAVATINNQSKPDVRNVVLRDVDEKSKSITFHTDKRSKKINHIENYNDVCALFYDQHKKIQLRTYGKIFLVNDKQIKEERWNKSKSMSKLCYLNKYPPGDKILSSKEYLPDENDLENIENGIENFSIIKIDIQSIDWLNLNYKGHERMIIDFLGNSKVNYRWVAP